MEKSNKKEKKHYIIHLLLIPSLWVGKAIFFFSLHCSYQLCEKVRGFPE